MFRNSNGLDHRELFLSKRITQGEGLAALGAAARDYSQSIVLIQKVVTSKNRGGPMTVEQDGIMKAILKAVNDGIQTGLTKSQIIAEVQKIEPVGDVRFSTLPPESTTNTPQRYGWSPTV